MGWRSCKLLNSNCRFVVAAVRQGPQVKAARWRRGAGSKRAGSNALSSLPRGCRRQAAPSAAHASRRCNSCGSMQQARAASHRLTDARPVATRKVAHAKGRRERAVGVVDGLEAGLQRREAAADITDDEHFGLAHDCSRSEPGSGRRAAQASSRNACARRSCAPADPQAAGAALRAPVPGLLRMSPSAELAHVPARSTRYPATPRSGPCPWCDASTGAARSTA